MSETAELHGHAMVQARDDWARMGNKGSNMIRARIGVYADALKAIAVHDVRVIVRALDIQAYRERGTDGRYDPLRPVEG